MTESGMDEITLPVRIRRISAGGSHARPRTSVSRRFRFDRAHDRWPLPFYTRVFDREIVGPAPSHLEVDDLDAILSRVWDFGGTILSISQPTSSRGAGMSATVADPNGHLVSIVQSARAVMG
jgi:hypothetical protein